MNEKTCKYCNNIHNACNQMCVGSQLALVLKEEDNVFDRIAGILNEINKSLSVLTDEYVKENVRRI